MLPQQKDIEIPLLKALMSLGGKARPRDIYPIVTKAFPEIPQAELMEKLASGTNKWTNRIQWARQSLVVQGQLVSPERGFWQITTKGIKRVEALGHPDKPSAESQPVSLAALYEEYESSFQGQLLELLHALTPRQFEQFSMKLMQAYGFVEVNITQVGPDGGIDGYGKLRLGLATINAAFQCKRWQGNVGRTEVDKFRGAIQGEYEQGVFFATSDFTQQAKDMSIRKGAVPIILLNGESIVGLMIEKRLGVVARPLYLYEPRPADFDLGDEEALA